MFQVFENGKPCDSKNTSIPKGKGWDNSIFNTFEEAKDYLNSWLGCFGPVPDDFTIGQKYDLFTGSIFEIRIMDCVNILFRQALSNHLTDYPPGWVCYRDESLSDELQNWVYDHLKNDWATAIGTIEAAEHVVHEAMVNGNLQTFSRAVDQAISNDRWRSKEATKPAIRKVDEHGSHEKNRNIWRNKDGKLHREDGPAIEYSNGEKCWCLNGKLHREDGPAVERSDGYKCWCLNGELHREDGPAIERSNGDKEWWLNGKLHRVDGPAVDFSNGDKEWYLNGGLHREDGPAIEYVDGTKFWYLNGKEYSEEEYEATKPAIRKVDEHGLMRKIAISNGSKEWWLNGEFQKVIYKNKEGKLHRENGPAIEWSNGTKEWWLNGKPHREDGPAVECSNGDKEWCLNGKLHREDGPAIEWADGDKSWYLNGKEYSEEEYHLEASSSKDL